MSEVTTLSSNRLEGYKPTAERQASPESTRQVGVEGGKTLPPSVSLEAQQTLKAQADNDTMSAAVARMNEYIQTTQRDLRFSVDKDSGETIVKVLDRHTQEVIRQIPDDVFLKLAQNLSVNEPVHFFSEQA